MCKNNLAPKAAVLELTYRCNHQCLFCSVPWSNPKGNYEKKREMALEEWQACIDELIRHGVRTFALSGGEPTLKESFKGILQYIQKQTVEEPEFDQEGTVVSMIRRPPEISVITNGAAIDREWVAFFREHRPLLTVSLPGLEQYAYLTGGRNRDQALQTIRAFSGAGLAVTVSICVTKRNLPELFETISLGFINGARQLLLNRFLPGGRGMEHIDLCLSKNEIGEMLTIAEEACQAAGIHGSVGTELPQCLLGKEFKMLHAGTMCSGGVDFFAVDPSGYVRPCNHSPIRLGTWHEFSKAIEHDYWQLFKNKRFLPEMCRECPLSLRCDGGCREAAHIFNGSIDSPDPVFATTE